MSETPASGSGLVGTMLAGRYRVLRKLGEGAMGAVYLAEHVRIGRHDAIKVLRDNLASDPEAIARFLRGTRNVSAIRHPNVCAIYDFSETETGLRFLAMEYVDGPTLKDVLEKEGVFAVERAVEIAAQVASALDAAHDAGVVHRDLKPGNIMLLRGRHGADVVKVVDFDIAKGPEEGGEEVTRMGFVIGTPEYMSPEQLMGEPLDGRSDVYALALVLFRMLTGSLPFRAEGTQDLMIARLTATPMRLDEARAGVVVPEALQRALDRALQRKPADRQTDAAEFGREIRAALAAAPDTIVRPIPSTPATADVPATRVAHATPGAGSRRKIGLVAGGAGALALVTVAAVILLSPGGNGVTANDNVLTPPPPPTGDPERFSQQAESLRTSTETDAAVPPASPPPPPPPPPSTTGSEVEGGIRFTGAADIENAITRLSELLLADVEPSRGVATAVRDTLLALREQATEPNHRQTAVHLLAWAEFYRGDNAACQRWVSELRGLGVDVSRLSSLCSGVSP